MRGSDPCGALVGFPNLEGFVNKLRRLSLVDIDSDLDTVGLAFHWSYCNPFHHDVRFPRTATRCLRGNARKHRPRETVRTSKAFSHMPSE